MNRKFTALAAAVVTLAWTGAALAMPPAVGPTKDGKAPAKATQKNVDVPPNTAAKKSGAGGDKSIKGEDGAGKGGGAPKGGGGPIGGAPAAR